MPDNRLIQHLGPVVEHMLTEHQKGMNVEHVVWEAALAGAYVGMGLHPVDALRRAEAMEAQSAFPTAGEEPGWLRRFEQERLRGTPMRYRTEEYT